MTALRDKLMDRITQDGPLTVAEYMQACLMDPVHGYYTTRDPFGQGGDFITAPEISQMFGELLGLCLAQMWDDQGAPDPFVLAELGPGRGTLMADLLRATKAVPAFHKAAQIVLVEASPTLRDIQKTTLDGFDIHWVDDIAGLPEGPLFLIANEFFDALPIRQFVRAPEGWQERKVGIKDGTLAFDLAVAEPTPSLDHRLAETETSEIVETCAAAVPILERVAAQIADHGGAAIVLDYGDKQSLGDTFQGVLKHAPVDVLQTPGEADLTAHVDFGALADAAIQGSDGRIRVSGLTAQAALLGRLGIAARAQKLAANLSGDALSAHLAAYHRLTDGAEMGTLFKAIALTPRGTPPPPGFDP